MALNCVLHDGRQVDSSSDDWRLECLAKYLLTTYNRGQIEEWLVDAESKGGRKLAGLRCRLNSIVAVRKSRRAQTSAKTISENA